MSGSISIFSCYTSIHIQAELDENKSNVKTHNKVKGDHPKEVVELDGNESRE